MTSLTESADGGTAPGGRVSNVDVLRAVAALMVVAGHAYFLSGRPAVTVVAERWYDVLILTGASGVWLFFAVSGYVIGKPFIDRLVTGEPLPGLAAYARRRVVRIFPLYWVVLTAFLVVAGAGATKGWEYVLHYLLLQNLVPGREYALLFVSWTLSIELLFYIAVPLLAVAVRARRREVSAEWLAGAILVTWVVSIACTTAADLLITGENAIWARVLFPSVWQMFCPGLLVALAPHLTSPTWRRWLIELPRRPAAIVFMVVLLVGAAIVSPLAPLRYGLNVWALVVDLTRIAWAVGFGLLLALALRARPARSAVALRLGLVSYGIYLIHPVLIDVLQRNWVPLEREGLGPYVVHLALVLGLTVPLALLSWRFLEEPLIRWARAFGRRGKPSPVGRAEPQRESAPLGLPQAERVPERIE